MSPGSAAHLRLEDLDQLELPTALELKALQLCQGSVKIEDCIALLDQLALFLACRQDHGLQAQPWDAHWQD